MSIVSIKVIYFDSKTAINKNEINMKYQNGVATDST